MGKTIKDQKKAGIIISYLNLVLSTCTSLFLTPALISALTDQSYSVYKVMHSLAGPLIMFNLGVSAVVTRSIAKYRAVEDGNKKEKQNTLAIALIVSCIMSGLVVLLGMGLYAMIPKMYEKTFSLEQIDLAKKIFLVLISTTAVQIVAETYKGCVSGHEKFVVLNGTAFLQHIIKYVLIIVFLKAGFGAFEVTLVELIIALLAFIIYLLYGLIKLKEYPKLHYLSKRELWEMASFSLAMLLQVMINQVNNSMDNVILGAMVDDDLIITMYSSALTIYTMYNALVSAMGTVFLPKATKLLAKEATGEELTDFVIKPGRIQTMLSVAILFGFALFGKNFIFVWIGEKYIDAYYVALITMVPVTIPLIQNVCLSILDASLKRLYRSIVLGIMAAVNLIISILLVMVIGFWGAAIGTAISLIVGHGILMNVYYKRKINLNVCRMFKELFRGTLLCGLLATIICLPVALLLENTVLLLAVKIAVFLIVYVALLCLIGFNAEEKEKVKGLFKRLKRKN